MYIKNAISVNVKSLNVYRNAHQLQMLCVLKQTVVCCSNTSVKHCRFDRHCKIQIPYVPFFFAHCDDTKVLFRHSQDLSQSFWSNFLFFGRLLIFDVPTCLCIHSIQWSSCEEFRIGESGILNWNQTDPSHGNVFINSAIIHVRMFLQ